MSAIRYTQYSYPPVGPIFLWVFPEKDCNEKKRSLCHVWGVIMISFFPRKNSEVFFAQKACINTERVPPGHPIILLKSNEFNMATVSVKRSINLFVIYSNKIMLKILAPKQVSNCTGEKESLYKGYKVKISKHYKVGTMKQKLVTYL